MSLERQGKTDIGRKLSHKVLSLPLGKAVTFAVFQNVGNVVVKPQEQRKCDFTPFET